MVKHLQAFAKAFLLAHDNHRRGLNSWEEYNETYPSSQLPEAFERNGYEPVFGVNFSEMKVGTRNFILAHPKAAATEGGLVLYANGDVKQITAAEFRQAFPAQMQGVATWPHELAEVGAKEKIRVKDEFFVIRPPDPSPSRIRMMEAASSANAGKEQRKWDTIQVSKVLPSGDVAVDCKSNDQVTEIIYQRWQLRRHVPLADRTKKPKTQQQEHWQAILKQRQVKLTAAITSTAWPEHDLVPLEPRMRLSPEMPLWAPWGPAMCEVRFVQQWRDGQILVALLDNQAQEGSKNLGIVVAEDELHMRMLKPAKEMYRPLRLFAEAYARYLKEHRRAPETWSEIGECRAQDGHYYVSDRLPEKFEANHYVAELGVTSEEMLGLGKEATFGELPSTFILAYPQNAAEKGGLVLLASGDVGEASAETFRKALAAQAERIHHVRQYHLGRALGNAKVKLIELSTEESPKEGDVVFFPVYHEMEEGTVAGILPNGRVMVRVGKRPATADTRPVRYFSRLELRKLAPAPPPPPPKIVDTAAVEAERLALRTKALERMFALYVAYTNEHRKGPEVWEDLGDELPLRRLVEANYVFFEGMVPHELKGGQENVVLAFSEDGEKKGGLILFADGSTRMVTAEEFKKLKKTTEDAWERTPTYHARAREAAKAKARANPMEELLAAYRIAYFLSVDSKSGHAPKDWDELELRGANSKIRRQFASAGYLAVFGLGPRDRPPTSGSFKFIIAYPKRAPQQGGLVMLHDGTVKQMTAKEFTETAAKQKELLSKKPDR